MMIIIYLSITLVVLGIVFIVTSVEVRTVSGSGISKVDDSDQKGSGVDSVLPTPGHSGQSVDSQMMNDSKVTVSAGIDQVIQHNKEILPVSGLDDTMITAVLYSDPEGVARNYSGTVPLEKIKTLSRIGEGVAELTPDAVTFRLDKKMFRFDFYRLEKVGGRDSTVVLFIRGSKGTNILIAQSRPDLFTLVESEYSRFAGR